MMCAVGRPILLRPMTILQPVQLRLSCLPCQYGGRVAMESVPSTSTGSPCSVGHQRRTGPSPVHRSAVILVVASRPACTHAAAVHADVSSSSPAWPWLLIILVVLLAVATVVFVLAREEDARPSSS